MDWGTHMVLAAKMLDSCKLDVGAAIYSVIPVIDKEPAHFHRVYAHILENQPDFLDVAREIFGSDEVKNRNYDALNSKIKNIVSGFEAELKGMPSDNSAKRRALEKKVYAYRRITEEAPTFVGHAENARTLIGNEKISNISRDKLSAGVSLLSHTYFDTFNNPVQVFLPVSSLCSAQWEFWNNVDYMKFREAFYKTENIIPFRKKIAESPIWNTALNPPALIKAMIIRLGEMGQPAIPYEVVDMGVRDFMRYMAIDDYQRADKELAFCRDLEREICDIIYKDYSKK